MKGFLIMKNLNSKYNKRFDGQKEVFFDCKELDRIIEHDNHMVEIWKRVFYLGKYFKYEVSNTGKVRNARTKELLSVMSIQDRYYCVSLNDPDTNMPRLTTIHRLMAIAFLPIPNKYLKAGYTMDNLVINHKDGYKHHNMLYNLEWCTVKENMNHAIDHNLIGYLGENSHLAKITEKEAIQICELISKGWNNQKIHDKMGASLKMIQHIRAGECWKHISKNYTFPKLGKAKPNTTPMETIVRICELLQEKKYKDKEIGGMVGKSREYVKDIRTRRRLKNISKDYDF